MSLLEVLLLAVGLSMDAFAVSIGVGLSMRRATFGNALIVALYFGIFQGGMLLIGHFGAEYFAEYLVNFGRWIAFVVLAAIGGKTVTGILDSQDSPATKKGNSVGPERMFPLAIATSIDAMAVGISFALASVEINLTRTASLVAVVTFILCILGTLAGSFFGSKFKKIASAIGGIILIFIAWNMLLA
jgi:putative Mn2+ efflux pump MntP